MPTPAEIKAAARANANGHATEAQLTPRELAEGAWTPTSPYTVDELEDRIRARRGLAPIHDASAQRSA